MNHPEAIGAIGALMNRVLQPRPLVFLGLNVWMGTAAGADELVEIPAQNSPTESGAVGGQVVASEIPINRRVFVV
jgi:hypothetical protein